MYKPKIYIIFVDQWEVASVDSCLTYVHSGVYCMYVCTYVFMYKPKIYIIFVDQWKVASVDSCLTYVHSGIYCTYVCMYSCINLRFT